MSALGVIAAGVVVLLLGAPAQQAPAGQDAVRRGPTVGDTIWVRRAVRLPPRYAARAAEWEPDGEVQLLGPPELVERADSVIVRYPLVAWTTGPHTVSVPSPLLLGPDGSMDSLPDASVSFTVMSLLPDRPATEIRPQPQAGIVDRRTVSYLPLIILGVIAAAVLAPLHWWWRRRGKPLPAAASAALQPVPIDEWAEAGEARSVLALAASRLRSAIRSAAPGGHDSADVEACVAMLAELDSSRFAAAAVPEALALYREADALAARLTGQQPVAAPA